jgi:hypothetical protein
MGARDVGKVVIDSARWSRIATILDVPVQESGATFIAFLSKAIEA